MRIYMSIFFVVDLQQKLILNATFNDVCMLPLKTYSSVVLYLVILLSNSVCLHQVEITQSNEIDLVKCLSRYRFYLFVTLERGPRYIK